MAKHRTPITAEAFFTTRTQALLLHRARSGKAIWGVIEDEQHLRAEDESIARSALRSKTSVGMLFFGGQSRQQRGISRKYANRNLTLNKIAPNAAELHQVSMLPVGSHKRSGTAET
jgi:hypothetical protein